MTQDFNGKIKKYNKFNSGNQKSFNQMPKAVLDYMSSKNVLKRIMSESELENSRD